VKIEVPYFITQCKNTGKINGISLLFKISQAIIGHFFYTLLPEIFTAHILEKRKN